MIPRRRTRLVLPALAAVALLPLPVHATGLAPGSPGSTTSGDSIMPARGNGGYQVEHYDIDLRWLPASSSIAASTVVRAAATQDLSAFNLELRGLAVKSVTVDGTPARWRRDGFEMTVEPAKAIPSGQTFTTEVRYAGEPRPYRTKQLGKVGWIRTKDGATALSEPYGSETWYPVNNTIRDKATYTVSVDVPNRLKAVSNGRLVRRDVGTRRTVWHWSEDRPMAPYLSTVSVGRYEMYRSRSSAGIPLISFVDARLGKERRSRRDVARIVDFLQRRFGKYPFATSGLVVDRMGVDYALETQSRPVIPNYAPAYIISHELAHQWFGNSVTPSDWKDVWLNEGFATYAEWLHDAWRYDNPRTPRQQFRFLYRIYGRDARFWKIPPGDPGSVNRLFSTPVYDRGAMTLQALRERVGDRAFFRILRRWASENEGGTVTTKDFKALAERVSGQQLDRFFRVWLYVPEKPRGY